MLSPFFRIRSRHSDVCRISLEELTDSYQTFHKVCFILLNAIAAASICDTGNRSSQDFLATSVFWPLVISGLNSGMKSGTPQV